MSKVTNNRVTAIATKLKWNNILQTTSKCQTNSVSLCQHNSVVLERNYEFKLTYLFQNTWIELSNNEITKKWMN